eukprot:EG_transcript_2780
MASLKDMKFVRSTRADQAEAALRLNKWDVEAWDALIQEIGGQPVDKVRPVYDAFFELFPTAAKYWRSYIAREMQAKHFDRVEKVLHAQLLTTPHSHLWQAYLDYVRGTKGKEELYKAYEFALDVVGSDANATTIWMGYFEFMRAQKAAGEFDENQLLNCRKRFKQVLEYQVHRLEEFWRMFETFETDNLERLYPNPRQPGDDKAASQQHLKDWSAKYKRSLVAYKEKQVLRQYLLEDLLPLPMEAPNSPFRIGDDGVALAIPNLMHTMSRRTREQLQPSLWLQLIQYERANPQKLDKAEVAKRVKLLYQQALLCLYYTPEIWIQAAEYYASAEGDGLPDAIGLYERGCKALPASALLHLAYADFLHAREENKQAEAVYRRYLEYTGSHSIDNTLVLIHFLKFTHKVHGLESCRQLFVRMKQTASWQFYTAFARLEWKLNKQPMVARNIFESGMPLHSGNLKFVMTYLDFLESLNDENNLQLLFEKIITQHNCPEVWARYLDYKYRYSDLAAARSVLERSETNCPRLKSRLPLRNSVNQYKFLDLAPLSSSELSALQQQEVLKLALARYVSTRLDKSTFEQLYGDMNSEFTEAGQALPTMGPSGDLVPHRNPLQDVLGPRMVQNNFKSLPAFTPQKNPTPPDPAQDQLSDVPCVPPSWAAQRAVACLPQGEGSPRPKLDPSGLPALIPGLPATHPANQMLAQLTSAHFLKEEDMVGPSIMPHLGPVEMPQGPPMAAVPMAMPMPMPMPAPAAPQLPSQLAKLLSALPPPAAYHGPLADVEELLHLLVHSLLPPPPPDPSGRFTNGLKRPPDGEEGPTPKRPAFDIYAQRQAMKSTS